MNLKETVKLRLFTLFKIPLIHFCRPKVLELNETACRVRIPFRHRVKNHIGSMYFGAIAAGADLAGGLIALHLIASSGHKIPFVFKEVHGEFLRRVHGPADFYCGDGAAIQEAIQQTIQNGERVHIPVTVSVTSPAQPDDGELARFELTLSMKKQGITA